MKVRFHATQDGAKITWAAVGAANRWDCVDEEPADALTTYIQSGPAATAYDSVKGNFASLVGGLITKVEVVVTARDGGAPHPVLGLSVWLGVTRADSATWSLTNVFVETTKDFTALRPGGGSWSFSDFTGGTFEWGVIRDNTAGTTNAIVTAVWCDVTVEFPGGFMSMVD